MGQNERSLEQGNLKLSSDRVFCEFHNIFSAEDSEVTVCGMNVKFGTASDWYLCLGHAKNVDHRRKGSNFE